ncbi:DUF523 domain-containing protein [Clostridium ganghwense]|uniref:DUF523 domain-containing protein n=1 Tax=Clostridium ganghwense TaxID=312089 RepID=A0ABT4CN79_9CLOT|nr:DUF523 domain-containing protein [Clostridium ganghwense]
MIVISACLCGVNCKYNGENNLNKEALALLEEGKAVVVCPEQMGGLNTPRVPHEIFEGDGADVLDGKARVINSQGGDSTEKFVKGAYEALKIAKTVEAKAAILKAKSPSCGCGKIYDGSFTGKKIKGNGITAELFMRNRIKVYTEDDIGEEF